jgi:hypothetical protein
MNSKKAVVPFALLTIILILPIATSLGMVVFKWGYGYYPVPFIVKKIYYSFKYQSSRRDEQIVDSNFKINTKGYETEYELKNMLNMPYYVFVKFNPKKEPVPASYQYNGSLKIVVTRNNSVQYSHTTNGISKVTLASLGTMADRPEFTDGYYVAVLPFPLKKATYNNTKLTITVTGVDNKLIPYAENAQVSIFPEIDLDSGVSDFMLETGIHNK